MHGNDHQVGGEDRAPRDVRHARGCINHDDVVTPPQAFDVAVHGRPIKTDDAKRCRGIPGLQPVTGRALGVGIDHEDTRAQEGEVVGEVK